MVFHGYYAASPDWFRLLPYVAQGFSVLALDSRGQGGLSQESGGLAGTSLFGHIIRGLDVDPRELLVRRHFLDTVHAAQILMERPEVDPARVGATGESQGGGLTLACAALEPRIRAAVPVFPFLSDYRRVWDLDLAVDATPSCVTICAGSIRCTSPWSRCGSPWAISTCSTWPLGSGQAS